jgi:hypothetical protein
LREVKAEASIRIHFNKNEIAHIYLTLQSDLFVGYCIFIALMLVDLSPVLSQKRLFPNVRRPFRKVKSEIRVPLALVETNWRVQHNIDRVGLHSNEHQ